MTAPTTLRHHLSADLTGGVLLLVAAVAGLAWASSPWQAAYRTVSDAVVGPAAWHLDLTVSTWAADGLLAMFFLVVGLELKRELVTGSLRDPRHAAVPALAAVGGMAVPAGIFALVVGLGGGDGLHGWAVPTATDIAFALAVLALVGRGVPATVRVFLLTLAVVDDLLAIVVIAVFYADAIHLPWLAAATVAVATFAAAIRWRPRRRAGRAALVVLLVALGLVAWLTLHAAGIHPTIAGVACGLAVPARPRDGRPSLAARVEHHVRPWSAAVAAPVFAFFAAGVPLAGHGSVLTEPVAWGVLLGLVVGKPVGVLGTTALLTRFTGLALPGGLRTRDLLGVGLLAGVGFTVSLLVARLAFDDEGLADAATLAVFVASLISAVAATVVLSRQRRRSVAAV